VRKYILPIIVLFIIAPLVEVFSGATSPEDYINPFTFFILTAWYGSGALLIREVKTRWKKGLATLLLLGVAFAVIEEGLMMKTFFDPDWADMWFPGYGRWMGVNWIFTQNVIIVHAIFSITIPILLVELIFPWSKDERWLGNIGFLGILILFILIWPIVGLMFFGNVFGYPYSLSIIQYASTISLIIFFILLAWVLPSGFGGHGSARGNAIIFFIFGFIWTLVFTMLPWINSSIIVFSAIIAWLFVMVIFLAHYDWSSGLHRLALIIGLISPLLVFLLIG